LAQSQHSARLATTTKLFYGFGSVAYGVKDNGFSYLLLIFYNQVVGLRAEVVGAAIMIALVVDAFLDPIVGQISDNWRSRWGRRHPFMYASALPVSVSYLLLWNPPHWSQGAVFAYLVITAIIIRTFITFYEIPSSALSAELTQEYDQRTSLLSYRYFFAWWGGLTLNFMAYRLFLQPDRTHAVGQLNPAGYARYGATAGVIMFIAILVSAAGTHGQIAKFRVPPVRKLKLAAMAREMISTWSNRSFLFLTLAGLATSMATGLIASLNVYFNTYYWELTANQISIFTLGVYLSAAMALVAAPILSRRFGKRPSAMVLIVCAVLISTAPVMLRFLGLFPPNHSPVLLPILIVQTIVSTGLSITGATLTSSMIADVVEDSELRTGRRSEGLLFSASSLVAKAVSGIGIFASGLLLLAIHFPRKAQPGHVPPEVIRHLALVYVPTIFVLYGLALIFLMGYRITRASHQDTLRRLAAEAERVASAAQ
jgi:glycoside/pentoside/hexuronide:cation symporter, GPH family